MVTAVPEVPLRKVAARPATAQRRTGTMVAMVGAAAALTLALGAAPAGAAPSTTAPGTVRGTVTVTGAPSGFDAEVGVGACPASTPPGQVCADPQYTLAGTSPGAYSVSLPAGRWRVAGFYEGNGGGLTIGSGVLVRLAPGGTVTRDLAVAYEPTTAVSGTVTVAGDPAGVPVLSVDVSACPVGSPPGSFQCVQGFGGFGTPADAYSLSLTAGRWDLVPSYQTEFGDFTAPRPTVLAVTGGSPVTVDLRTPYQAPTNGLVEGTVTVTGAPAGFSATVGALACPGGGTTGCAQPQSTEYGPLPSDPGTYQIALPAGAFSLAGFYSLSTPGAPPVGGDFTGPGRTVTAKAGTVLTVNLAVPYVPPGSVFGRVRVTGIPAGTQVAGAVVEACPAAQPLVPPAIGPTCAGVQTPLVADFSMTTLPPGSWLLYPGYLTGVGDDGYEEVLSVTGVPVTVTSGQVTTRNLTVAFDASSLRHVSLFAPDAGS